MNIFKKTNRTASIKSATLLDVQNTPIPIGDPMAKPVQQIKVDLVCRIDSQIIIAGWTTAKNDLGLRAGSKELELRRMMVARPDVATHFDLPNDQVGFVLVADHTGTEAISLTWEDTQNQKETTQPLKFSDAPNIGTAEHGILGPALGFLALSLQPHTPQWRSLIANALISAAPCSVAKGYLEHISACNQTKDAIVVGWLVQKPNTPVWLEDDAGNTFALEVTYRRFRQDVHDAVGHEFGHVSQDAGLVARVPGLKVGSKVMLKTISEAGVHILAEAHCGVLPLDPLAAARWLFSIGIPLEELHHRVPLIDEPVLGPLIQYREEIWDELPIRSKQLGKPLDKPAVSVIIPLYGRVDFVEHQMMEFYNDPWLARHAELIYVLDDPKLVEGFIAQAEALHRLYRLPFRWVWGSVNRGFSGANNLGVKHARGEHLVFLNSDAFPQRAGWLQALVDVLIERPDIGAVGPRLVFADGSIQHAGMEFMRRDELGVWVNHHPRMGLDPSLDPSKELSIVPSVTGACLAMRRADFDYVGGWDTGYLIGDFEDSDLCLKLRAAGLHIAYLPSVQLTHLERQSFKLLGNDEFRTRVVIYNAVRHQSRWASLIEAPATETTVQTEYEIA